MVQCNYLSIQSVIIAKHIAYDTIHNYIIHMLYVGTKHIIPLQMVELKVLTINIQEL